MSEGLRIPTLATVAGGAAEELFASALATIMANVDDPNTAPGATRKITLTFTLKPNERREGGSLSVACGVKLAGVQPHDVTVFMGRHEGQLALVEALPQEELFNTPVGKPKLAAEGGL